MTHLTRDWRCVVFDLDGTLLDTRSAMVAAINATLTCIGRSSVLGADLSDATHEGLESMLHRALSLTGTLPDAHTLEHLQFVTSEGYLASSMERVELFAAALALLDALQRRGIWMAVCTNQREAHARALLSTFGLAHYFAAVVGRNTFDVHKPNPLPLMWLIGRCGVRPEQTLMIGDSDVDARCALQAGATIVLMEHGYGVVDAASDQLTCENFASLHALLFDEMSEQSIEEIDSGLR
jgi:phosphoglycolate phosphatase